MFAKFIRNSALVPCCLALVAMGVASVGLTGCSATKTFRQAIARNKADDVSPTRKERQTELAREFDKKRDDTQFDAAASSWERGDPESCEVALKQLLERNPKYRRAHLLLADLYMFNNQSDLAINELTQAIALDEKDPAAQHALAQALDGAGLHQEALEHYQTATQLQPMNELYALSFKSALGVVPPSVAPNMQSIEMIATTSNPTSNPISNPISEPTKFAKQIGKTIDNTRTTMSPMVAKMPALAQNKPLPTRMAKGEAKPQAVAVNANTANTAAAVASVADDEQVAISDTVADPTPAPFVQPQLAMANAGGTLPTQRIPPPEDATGADENDPDWRLAGVVRDSKQKPEFQAPITNLDSWVRPVHYDPRSANEVAAQQAAPAQGPRYVEAQPVSNLPPSRVTRAVVTEPVVAPAVSQAPTALQAAAQAPVAQQTAARQTSAPQTRSVEQAKPSPSARPVSPVVQVVAAQPGTVSAPKDPSAALGKAVESLAAGDSNAAIDAATNGLARTPDEAGALYRVLGAAHYRKGEYEAAQAALAQALSLDKTDALAYFLMGSTLEKLNEPAAASSYFSQAARLDARYAR